tara:strand:- start:20578 stop:21708 length:1131 start_codon:yes stop_codon:yes gene_type:complete
MENENITTEAPQVEQPQVEQPQVEAPQVEQTQESQPEVQFFDNAEDFAKSMQQTQAQPDQPQETQYVDPEAAPAEPTPQQGQPQYTNQQVEEAMFGYLSERLGRDINSFDDLTYMEQEAPQLDERIQKISQFVQDTGRSPEDYLAYQKMDPSNMDDMSVLLVNTSFEYPNLSNEEVRLLVSSKYKTDPEVYSEQEVQISRLQMKVDAETARKSIDEVRETYRAPMQEQADSEESFIDDEWLANMRRETSALTGLEFDLGNGSSFQFGLDDNYRNQLIQKNAQIEDYFDPYVSEDGTWDYDKLNSHRAVVDNIDQIVANAYRQGISDGQRNVVTKVANSSVESPQTNPNQNPVDPINEQLKGVIGSMGRGLSFNPRI